MKKAHKLQPWKCIDCGREQHPYALVYCEFYTADKSPRLRGSRCWECGKKHGVKPPENRA